MFLIVGLGNPGKGYEKTRHNVGFMLVDRLCAAHGMDCSTPVDAALAGSGDVKGVPVTVIKPQTYMNRSGEAVEAHARRLGVEPASVLVAYDDVDLPLGQIRLRRGGGTGGHKGMESVAFHLGTFDFPRLRLGIGRPAAGEVSDYVLSPFAADEAGALDGMLTRGVEAVEAVLTKDIDYAMNRYNAPQ